MKKKYITITVIAIAIIGSTLGFYLLKKSLNNNNSNKLEYYKVSSAEKIFINGKLTPKESENIYLDATKGTVSEVHVNDGQAIKAGDTLFTYSNEAVISQIDQLSYQIESNNITRQSLSKKLENTRVKLIEKQDELESIKQTRTTLEEVGNNDIVQSATQQLEAQIDAYIEQMEAYNDQIESVDLTLSSLYDQSTKLEEDRSFTVVSPIDGKVILSKDEKNMTIPYMTIESEELVVKGTVSEKDHGKINLEDFISVMIVPTNESVDGKISSIGDRPVEATAITMNQTTNTNVSYYDVTITLNSQESLTNGFHSQGKITLGDDTIKVPKSAIVNEENKEYVFVNQDGILNKIEITTEDFDSEEVIVKSGLNANDLVMKNPTADMKEGIKVE